MYERDSNNILRIEEAEIWGLNFSGEASKFNRPGDRNFCVDLDCELGEILEKEGWNVKWRRDEDGNVTSCFIQVKVNFEVPNPRLRPKIYTITGGRKVLLNEDTVGALDSYDIITNDKGRTIADLEIRPREWHMDDGKHGVKAYLSEMYVTINESKFARKYADYEE